eukprot:TRINITY_DN2690_c0_g1_i1.p1 TRINITY_DN2690_c0_g1~~TRINITY_DN2690_c0_g1_i1.p1  ORF type:complete len:579 (+),score=149.34 TRINITY_DN2690_c0_g1_i1:541-2277(+)
MDLKFSTTLLSKAFFQMGLKLDLLKKAGTVSMAWRRAALECLSKLRKIQYSFPGAVLGEHEKKILWNNRRSWLGHDKWIVQLLKATDWKNEAHVKEISELLRDTESARMPCWETMCTSSCQKSTLTEPENALQLLSLRGGIPRGYAVKCLERASEREIEFYLPLLVHHLRCEGVVEAPLWEFLVEKALGRAEFRIHLYWALTLASEDRDNKRMYDGRKDSLIAIVTQKLGIDEAYVILNGLELVSICEKLKQYKEAATKQLNQLTQVHLPFNPHIIAKAFQTNKITIKDSATAPLVIPVDIESQQPNSTLRFMFKNEDLRKDQLVMNLIQLANIILNKHNLPTLLTYEILPTASDSGMLQMVDHASTLYDITKNSRTIWNYFIQKNLTHMQPLELHKTFTNSVAVYSVMSYILDVGDRHLENIMVTHSAQFFHIDYGFILGEEPFWKNAVSSKAPVRITDTMREALIVALGESAFEQFIEICCEIFALLRSHHSLFLNMIAHLHSAKPPIQFPFSFEKVQQDLVERFKLNYTDEEAKKLFKDIFFNSSLDTYWNILFDGMHKIKKVSIWQEYVPSFWK